MYKSQKLKFALMSSGRWDMLERCLKSLSALPHSKIIVCPTPPPELLQSFFSSQDIIVIDRSLHVGHQRNRALELCQCEWVYFLDEDCEAPSVTALHQSLAEFERNPDLVAMGGPYVSPNGISWSGQVYNHMTNLWLERINSAPYRFCFVGGNMLINLSRLPQKVRFASTTAFGGEEIEFFSQLHNDTFQGLLVDSLAVPHRAQHSVFSLAGRALLHGKKSSASWERRRFPWFRLLRHPLLSLGALSYVGLVQLRRLSFLSFLLLLFCLLPDTSGAEECVLAKERVGMARMSLPTFSTFSLVGGATLSETQLGDSLKSRMPVTRIPLNDPEFTEFSLAAPTPFFYEGFLFPSVWHFMMAMPHSNPMDPEQQGIFAKWLGESFSKDAPIPYDENIFRNGLLLKFRQNPRLKQQLLSTGENFLVLQSQDGIWGNGLDDRGENRLGKQLMQIRRILLADQWTLLHHDSLLALRQWALLHGHRIFVQTHSSDRGRAQRTKVYVLDDEGTPVDKETLKDYSRRFLTLFPSQEGHRAWTWMFVANSSLGSIERALEITTVPLSPFYIKVGSKAADNPKE